MRGLLCIRYTSIITLSNQCFSTHHHRTTVFNCHRGIVCILIYCVVCNMGSGHQVYTHSICYTLYTVYSLDSVSNVLIQYVGRDSDVTKWVSFKFIFLTGTFFNSENSGTLKGFRKNKSPLFTVYCM